MISQYNKSVIESGSGSAVQSSGNKEPNILPSLPSFVQAKST